MQKYRRSISYVRISCPGFVFRPKTGLPPLDRWRLINRRTRFARGPRRPRGGTYLKIPVARTFQFVIGNICTRACALCNFGTLCIAPWLLGHGSDINHPSISLVASSPLPPKPASPRKLRDPFFLCFSRRNYIVPLVYINFAAPNDASSRPLQGILEKTLETRSR